MMHIAYFINQYPAVSHSFIRREIIALENKGLNISRFAIRPEANELVDNADIAEQKQTRYIIKTPKFRVLHVLIKQLFFNTAKLIKTVKYAFGFYRKYPGKLIKVFICFVEACVLAEWVRQEEIDHVHAHFATNSLTVVLFTHHLTGVSYSFTMHGSEEFDRPESIGFKDKIKYAHFVAAISCYTRSQLYRWSDVSDWNKIHIIRCGVDKDFLEDSITPVCSDPVLLTVGRFCEQKGQLLLLQAFKKLTMQHQTAKLVMVGDGLLKSQIQDYIQQHGLSNSVELTGSLDGKQIREKISQARAFVLPSFAEGLPVVIMEAFALARPVISTYVGGIPELVKPGENGWLVPASSVEDLVMALNQVIDLPIDRLNKMGRQGRQKVIAQHSVDKEADKLQKLFAHATRQTKA